MRDTGRNALAYDCELTHEEQEVFPFQRTSYKMLDLRRVVSEVGRRPIDLVDDPDRVRTNHIEGIDKLQSPGGQTLRARAIPAYLHPVYRSIFWPRGGDVDFFSKNGTIFNHKKIFYQ